MASLRFDHYIFQENSLLKFTVAPWDLDGQMGKFLVLTLDIFRKLQLVFALQES